MITNNKKTIFPGSKLPLIKITLISISILALITSCSKSTEVNPGSSSVDCNTVPKLFSADVKPIIQASCGGCHGAGSSNGPGELISYPQVFNARASIRAAVISGAMPKGGSLTAANKNSIICWIDNGALDN